MPILLFRQGTFMEELFLGTLPGDKLEALFYFHHRSAITRHHEVFPRAIQSLLRANPYIHTVELSITRGRWFYSRWGRPALGAKPVGAELRVTFMEGTPLASLPLFWGNLTHGLSGIFCSSLNFLSRPEMYGPQLVQVRRGHAPGYLKQPVLYAALPQESVCTENLTPWLRLLPCRGHAGLSSLMNRKVLFGGGYHSLGVRIQVHRDPQHHHPVALSLSQSFHVVLHPSREGHHGAWTLENVFKTPSLAPCELASVSRIYQRVPGGLGHGNQWAQYLQLEPPVPGMGALSSRGSVHAQDVKLSSESDPTAALALWDLHGDNSTAGLATRPISKKLGPAASQQTPHWLAHRYVTGFGNLRGGLTLMMERQLPGNSTAELVGDREGAGEVLCVYQVIPWFIRLWVHTLTLTFDQQVIPFLPQLVLHHITPAQDRQSPLIMDLCFHVPPGVQHVGLKAQFTKGFLGVFEYPPDAHRGFDVAAAWVRWTSPVEGTGSSRQWRAVEADGLHRGDGVESSPLLDRLREDQMKNEVYTEGNLVTLAPPDFSMPYNVICFTSTVLAVFFGTCLNLLLSRLEDDTIKQRDKQARVKKIVKVVGVMILFMALALYIDPGMREEILGPIEKMTGWTLMNKGPEG